MFRLDLLTDHELETSKSLEINESVFEFMESSQARNPGLKGAIPLGLSEMPAECLVL